MLFDTIPSPIFYKDTSGIYKNCNSSFSEAILGIPRDKIIGKSLFDFPDKIPKEKADIYHEKDNALLEKLGVQLYSSDVRCSDGISRHYNFYKAAVVSQDNKPVGIVGVMMDITDLKLQEEKLKELASKDTLTSLFTRRYFNETAKPIFKLAQRNQTTLSLLMLDIDRFKSINDTYGHKIGDDMLIVFSDKILELKRESDVAARWGGEEFLLLLPNTNMDGALIVAEKIRHEIQELIFNKSIKYTVSIGVSTLNSKNDNLELLIHRADMALYEAKTSGRNRVCKSEE